MAARAGPVGCGGLPGSGGYGGRGGAVVAGPDAGRPALHPGEGPGPVRRGPGGAGAVRPRHRPGQRALLERVLDRPEDNNRETLRQFLAETGHI